MVIGILGGILFFSEDCMALPQDPSFDAEHIAIAQEGKTMIIDQHVDKAIINWQDYSIATHELVQYRQPNDEAIALNKITGSSPSAIMGSLVANGQIFIINPNGILFGHNSKINTAGLLATTLNISDGDFFEGNYIFSQDQYKQLSFIINMGEITIADNGYVVIVAPLVSNDGLIIANLGEVHVGSAEQFTVNFDGRNLINFEITTPPEDSEPGTIFIPTQHISDIIMQVVNYDGLIEECGIVEDGDMTTFANTSGTLINNGIIQTDGKEGFDAGTITLDATHAIINTEKGELSANGVGQNSSGGNISIEAIKIVQHGALHADATINNGGAINLNASRLGLVAPNSITTANAGTHGNGGSIVLFSPQQALFFADATIEAKGGSVVGDGGFTDTSGKKSLKINTVPDVSATNGLGGTWLIDPEDITITDATANITVDVITYTPTSDDTATTLDKATIITALNAGTSVTINTTSSGTATSGTITVSSSIAKTAGGTATLTLTADEDIVIDAEIISTTGLLNVALTATDDIDINDSITTRGGSFVATGASLDLATLKTIRTSAAVDSTIASGIVDINVTGTGTAALLGTIVTTGANNSAGTGSAGGAVTIDTANGVIGITGDITTTGGNSSGGNGDGGAAGTITVTTGNNNVITLNGSDFTAVGGTKNGSGTAGAGATINFDDPVTLATGSVAITTGTTAGNIVFDQTIDGNKNLSLTAGTGNITFTGAVGDTTPLSTVTIASATNVAADLAFTSKSLTQTAGAGTTTFTGAVTTTGTAGVNGGDVNIAATVGNIVFGSTIKAHGGTATGSGKGGGDVTLHSTTGTIAVAGTISTIGSAATTISTFGGSGGDVTLTTDGTDNITVAAITTSGGTGYLAGNGGAAGNVSLTSTDAITTLGGNITAAGGAGGATGTQGSGGAITCASATVLGTNITVDTGATAGIATFSDTLRATTAYTETLGITAGTGNVVFTGIVGGGSKELGAVTITSAGNVTADLAFTAASLTQTAGAGTTTFTGAVTTTGKAETAGGAVNIAETVGNISFATITTNGGTSTGIGRAGGAITLHSTEGTIAVTGTISTIGIAAATSNVGGAGGTVTLTTDGSDAVTVAAITTSGGAGYLAGDGGDAGAISLTSTGATTTLGGNITAIGGAAGATGTQGDGGAVTCASATALGTNITINTGATAGTVTFSDTLRAATAYTETLGITAGTGNVVFAGIVGGGSKELGAVTITSAGNVTADLAFTAASLTQTAGAGTTTFTGTVTTTGKAETAGGAVNIAETVGNISFATITTNGGTSTGIGRAGGAITLHSTEGTIAVTGTISTIGSAAATNNVGGAGGNVTLTTDGTDTITAAAITTSGGAGYLAGNGGVAGAISITSTGTTTTLNGDITTVGGTAGASGADQGVGGSVTFNSATVLGDGITIDTGATAGTVTFASTLNGTTSVTETLGITAGTGDIDFDAAIGTTTAPGTITITSAANVTADSTINVKGIAQSAGTGTTTFQGAITTSGTTGIVIVIDTVDIVINDTITIAGSAIYLYSDNSITITEDLTVNGNFLLYSYGSLATEAITVNSMIMYALDGDATIAGDLTMTGSLVLLSLGNINTASNITATSYIQIASLETVLTGNIISSGSNVGISANDGSITTTGNITAGGGYAYADATENISMTGDILADEEIDLIAEGTLTTTGTITSNTDYVYLDGTTSVTTSGEISARYEVDLLSEGTITLGGAITSASTFGLYTTGAIAINAEISGVTSGIDITSETIDIAANISGATTIELEPYSTTSSIGIGADATGDYNLTATEIARLQNGFTGITIGKSSGKHAITVNAITFNDPTTIRTPSGGSITVDGQITMSGADALVIDGSGATTTLNADIVTAGGTITISDAVLLGTDITLNAANGVAAGANISIAGTTNSVFGETNDLTLNAGTGGTITLTGAVGTTTTLDVLTIANSNGATCAGALTAATVAITDTTDDTTVAFQGNTTITTLTTEAQGYNLSFTGTTNTITNAVDFLNTGTVIIGNVVEDAITFTTGVDFTNGPSSAIIMGTINTTDTNMTFGTVTLAGNTTIDTGIGDATFNGTVNGAYTLTIDAGATGDITFSGIVGATSTLASLTITDANDVTINENMTITGAITATADSIVADADALIIASGMVLVADTGIGSASGLKTRIASFTATNSTSGAIWIRNNTTAGVSASLTIPADGVTNASSAIRIEQGNLTFNDEALAAGSDTTTGGDLIIIGTIDAATTVKLHVMGSILDRSTSGSYDVIGVGTCEMLAFNGNIGEEKKYPVEVNIDGDLYVYASQESSTIGVAINGTVQDSEELSEYNNYISTSLVLFNNAINGGESSLNIRRPWLAQWLKDTSPITLLKSNDPTLFDANVVQSMIDNSWFEPIPSFWINT